MPGEERCGGYDENRSVAVYATHGVVYTRLVEGSANTSDMVEHVAKQFEQAGRMHATSTRRSFLRRSLYAGAGLWVFGDVALVAGQMPARPRRVSPNEKMAVAGVGAGGQGYWDIVIAGKGEEIVAIADVDSAMAYRAFQAFPRAKQYKDFRKMLDEMGERIDAVTVSTPDHQHAVAAMTAIRMGKHVYVQSCRAGRR